MPFVMADSIASDSYGYSVSAKKKIKTKEDKYSTRNYYIYRILYIYIYSFIPNDPPLCCIPSFLIQNTRSNGRSVADIFRPTSHTQRA